MRIHIQNVPNDSFPITVDQWRAAVARAEDRGVPHSVSFGDDDAAFAEGLAVAEALIAAPATLVGRSFAVAPELQTIFCTAAGLDRLMPFDWLPSGVTVLNNRGVHGAKTGEYAAMALLMLNARMPAFVAAQQAGAWQPQYRPTLRGAAVTVLGTGDLGAAAARQARHFGAVVTGIRTRAEPHPDFDTVLASDALDTVLPATQFLVVACPLTPATRNLLHRTRLAALPAGAALVNIGRGAILDQDALCDLLDSGHLSGAVLDVFNPEPPPPDHRIWRTRNLLATPHVAADDPTTYNDASLDIFLANLRASREGLRMPNTVDLARGY
jgi:phosphoglycerate dehydrogenase-like enzyme